MPSLAINNIKRLRWRLPYKLSLSLIYDVFFRLLSQGRRCLERLVADDLAF